MRRYGAATPPAGELQQEQLTTPIEVPVGSSQNTVTGRPAAAQSDANADSAAELLHGVTLARGSSNELMVEAEPSPVAPREEVEEEVWLERSIDDPSMDAHDVGSHLNTTCFSISIHSPLYHSLCFSLLHLPLYRGYIDNHSLL